MPIISQAISELQTHVYKPVIDQVSHRILQRLGYDKVIGDRIYTNTDFATHSQTSTIENDAVVGQKAFRVDAQIRDNPSSQKWDCYTFHHTAAYGISNVLMNDTFSPYIDKENSIRIKEFRSPVTIEMNCELILDTADLGYQAPQELFNSWDNGAIIDYMDLVYDYPVPKVIVNLLHAVWRLDRIKGEPAGVSFEQYINKHTDKTFMWNVQRTLMNQYELIVPCFDLKALFNLEYSDDRPQADKSERMSTSYVLSFIATIQFGLPTINILQLPVAITNQLIPPQMIPRDRYNRFNRIYERHHGHADEYYDKMHNGPKFPQLAQLPHYDEWKVPPFAQVCKQGGKEAFAIMHLLVDENEDLTTTINLDDFKDDRFAIPNVVKEIFYQQGAESVEYDALYTVTLFRDDKQLKPYDDFTFDENLQLKFKALNLYSHYRLVLFAPTDIYKVNGKWWWLFTKYFPWFNYNIQSQIDKAIQNGGILHDSSKYPDRVVISTGGNIYDQNGNFIENIRDNKLTDKLGEQHANNPDARIFRNCIIAYNASQSKTRTSR